MRELCRFEARGEYQVCVACGKTFRDRGKPIRTVCRSKCVHMGGKTATQAKRSCETCGGLPVYRCEIHRLCTPHGESIDHPVIRACAQCDDYQAQQ